MMITLYWYLQDPDGATISANASGTIMNPGDVGNLSEVCHWRNVISQTLKGKGFTIRFQNRKRVMIATRGTKVMEYTIKRVQEHTSFL